MKYTLKNLQEFGCLATNLSEIDSLPNATEVSSFEGIDNLEGILVQQGSDWIAIASNESVENPRTVYSCKDDTLCIHKLRTSEFCVMQIVNRQLNMVKKKKILKEGNRMPDINAKLAQLKQSKVLSESEKEARKAKMEANKAVKAAMDNQISSAIGNVEQVSNPIAQENNREKGVLFGYITESEPVVKMSLASKVKEVNGQRVVLPEYQNEAKVVEARNANKAIPAKFCEKEKSFAFVEKAPGKIKALVIGTPAKTNISLSYVGSGNVPQIDESKSDTLEVQFFGLEQGFANLLWNYGGEIKESKDIMGENAGIVTVAETRKLDEDTQRPVIRYRLNVSRPNKDNRKVTRTNMFPVKRYRTVPAAQAGQYISTAIESIMTSKLAKAPQLDQIKNASMHNITVQDGKYTADWCDGAPMQYVKFDDKEKNEVIATEFPIITKKVNEEKQTTRFVYETADIEAPDGPLSVYGNFVKATRLSEDVFVARIKGLTSRGGNGGAKGPKKVANPMEALRAMLSPNITTNGHVGGHDIMSTFANEIKRMNSNI